MIFFPAPIVQLVELDVNQLVFQSKKFFKLGQAITVRVPVQSLGGSSHLVTTRVFVYERRPVGDGQFVYVGTLLRELPFQPDSHLNAEAGPGRRQPRRSCRLRVLSPHLPNYTGLSVDFSRTGLQLKTRDPLTLGQVMELRLETRLEGMECIWVHARVAWCRRERPKAFRSGLEFQQGNSETRAQLERLEVNLRLRESADVNQLVLECAEL